MPIPSFPALRDLAEEAYRVLGDAELDNYRFEPQGDGMLAVVRRLATSVSVAQPGGRRKKQLEERRRIALAQGIRRELDTYFGVRLSTILANDAGIDVNHWMGPRQILVIGRGQRPLIPETLAILRILHGQRLRVSPGAPARAVDLAGLDIVDKTVPRMTSYGDLSKVCQTEIRTQLFELVTGLDPFVLQRMRREDLTPLLRMIKRRQGIPAARAATSKPEISKRTPTMRLRSTGELRVIRTCSAYSARSDSSTNTAAASQLWKEETTVTTTCSAPSASQDSFESAEAARRLWKDEPAPERANSVIDRAVAH
jgi:hypothetical protein